MKGDDPRTEHYSALGPEVGGAAQRRAGRPAPRRSTRSSSPARRRATASPGRSSDLLDDVPAERVYLLEDCTSPVVVPGAVDFTEQANAAVAALRRARRQRRPLDRLASLTTARFDVAAFDSRTCGPARRRARAARSGGSGGRPSADARPSVKTMSPVKSFSPRISDEPTPYASTGTPACLERADPVDGEPAGGDDLHALEPVARRARRAPSGRAAR